MTYLYLAAESHTRRGLVATTAQLLHFVKTATAKSHTPMAFGEQQNYI